MIGLYGHDEDHAAQLFFADTGALACKCLASAAVADTLLTDPTQRDAPAACSAPRTNFE
jgi:hypothetical protein